LWAIDNWDYKDVPQELKDFWERSPHLNPLKLKDEERPLVVLIHGGPHGAISGSFLLLRTLFLLAGYRILAPNFSGSAGFGQKFIERILGDIGDEDAKEIVGMVQQVTVRKLCDPKKVIAYGGSYGGYMTGILGSRFSDYFRCGIMLNPVVNIPFMFGITDIPDWCLAESCAKGMTWNLAP